MAGATALSACSCKSSAGKGTLRLRFLIVLAVEAAAADASSLSSEAAFFKATKEIERVPATARDDRVDSGPVRGRMGDVSYCGYGLGVLGVEASDLLCISLNLLDDEEWGRAGMKAWARHREEARKRTKSDRMARPVVVGLCVGGVRGQGVRNGSRRSTKKAGALLSPRRRSISQLLCLLSLDLTSGPNTRTTTTFSTTGASCPWTLPSSPRPGSVVMQLLGFPGLLRYVWSKGGRS